LLAAHDGSWPRVLACLRARTQPLHGGHGLCTPPHAGTVDHRLPPHMCRPAALSPASLHQRSQSHPTLLALGLPSCQESHCLEPPSRPHASPAITANAPHDDRPQVTAPRIAKGNHRHHRGPFRRWAAPATLRPCLHVDKHHAGASYPVDSTTGATYHSSGRMPTSCSASTTPLWRASSNVPLATLTH
jgi:hypothetical protein